MTKIDIEVTSKRQIEWNVPSATITGTIQWEGQAAKAITGAITYRETLNNLFLYDWAYHADDRPTTAVAGVITLTGGGTTVSIPVEFTAGNVPTAEEVVSAIKADPDIPKYGDTQRRSKVLATSSQLDETVTKVS